MIKLKLKNKKGFTLIETLVACWVLLLALGFVTSAFYLIKSCSEGSVKSEDNIAIQQLRWILAQSEDIEIDNNILFFTYHNQEQRLVFDRNRLVKMIGYEIMMQKIDNLSFESSDSRIYLRYQRGVKEYNEEIYRE